MTTVPLFLLSYAFCYYRTYSALYHKTFLNLSCIFQCSSIKSSLNTECETSSAMFCFSTLPQVAHRPQLLETLRSIYFCLKISAAIWLPLLISSRKQSIYLHTYPASTCPVELENFSNPYTSTLGFKYNTDSSNSSSPFSTLEQTPKLELIVFYVGKTMVVHNSLL